MIFDSIVLNNQNLFATQTYTRLSVLVKQINRFLGLIPNNFKVTYLWTILQKYPKYALTTL